jgi:glucosamine-6-phosphate deaminase
VSLEWIRADDYEAMSRLAAARMAGAIDRRLAQKCPMLLGLATGNTMLRVYERLAGLLNERGDDLALLHTVNLDEYVGADGRWVPADHPLSYHTYMQTNLFGRLDPKLGMRAEQIHFPDPQRPGQSDDMLARMGRLDFQLLGIGFNGHIAFNEPIPAAEIGVEAFAAQPTRVVDLSDLTIATNARLTAGGDRTQVPRQAVTLGMKPILNAREILLLACFPEQVEPLNRMRRGRPTPELPASYLLDHPHATIIYAGDRVCLEETPLT